MFYSNVVLKFEMYVFVVFISLLESLFVLFYGLVTSAKVYVFMVVFILFSQWIKLKTVIVETSVVNFCFKQRLLVRKDSNI